MAVTRKEEGRALSNEERDIVARTRHPEIQKLPDDALSSLVKRLRDMRDRARSQANQQRREVRGKSEPEGGAPKTGAVMWRNWLELGGFETLTQLQPSGS